MTPSGGRLPCRRQHESQARAKSSSTPRRQRGVYIIAIAVLLGIAVSLLAFGLISDLARSNVQAQSTAAALDQAKQALIGYAAAYRDRVPPTGARTNAWGFLPCPDMDGSGLGGEGVATNCGATDVTVIGRLPWRTLDLPPLRDGSGECLWYAVSGNFKHNPKTGLMNWDTNGLIEIMAPDATTFVAGAAQTNRAAAVIFSPGAILPGQDRSLAAINPPRVCGGNYNAANYLDSDTASAINNATAPSATANALTRFIAALDSDRTPATNDQFNDRVVYISPNDIFAKRVNLREDVDPALTDPTTGMLRLMADCVVRYGKTNFLGLVDKRLPWAAPLTISNFGTATLYDDGTGIYSGRFPYRADNSAAFIGGTGNSNVLAAGGVLLQDTGSQPCLNWAPVDEFWDNWKDHAFYAVAKAFAPNNLAAGTAVSPCLIDECLTVDGVTGIAAVVIFAGRKQTGQTRNNDSNPAYTSVQKSNPANYLEAINALSIQNNSPNMAMPRIFTKVTGNDTVMCVRLDPDPTVGLFLDPTCGTTAVCSADGNSLAGYRSGNTNNCKVGNQDVLPACQTLVDRINSNNCVCEKYAKQFIKKQCLDGFSLTTCQDAYNNLLAC